MTPINHLKWGEKNKQEKIRRGKESSDAHCSRKGGKNTPQLANHLTVAL